MIFINCTLHWITELESQWVWRLVYPVRQGEHPNTAFGLALALDYTRAPQVRIDQVYWPLFSGEGGRLGAEDPCKCHRLLLGRSVWKEKHFNDLFVFAGTVQSPLNQAAMTSSPPVSRSPPWHSFIASSAQKVVHLVSLWVQATAFPPSVASWCFDQWWYYHAGSVAPWLSDRRPILWQGCLKTTFFSGAIQICSTNLPS